jgi:hypothetical protein
MSIDGPFLFSVTVGYLALNKNIETFPHILGCQVAGTDFQGATLFCLREVHDLQSSITEVIALGE